MLDKTGKTTHRLKQDNPSFGTHPYRERAAYEYSTSVFMHPMEVNLGFELEHQFSCIQAAEDLITFCHISVLAAVCQRDRMMEVPYICRGLD